jgi:hypothetical protein
MAEMMAQNWGNIDSGVIELEQNSRESTMMAYAWDLETNSRQTKIFHVPHSRHTKKGVKKLEDPRDIYEATANQGARRLRACILAIIPGDIQDAAVEACTKTLAGGSDVPLSDRVRNMVSAFSALNVSAAMIEKRLGHILDVTSEHELVTLRGIYTSIKDNQSDASKFFEVAAPEQSAATQAVMDKLRPAKPTAPDAPDQMEQLEPEPAMEQTGDEFVACAAFPALGQAQLDSPDKVLAAIKAASKHKECRSVKTFDDIDPADQGQCSIILALVNK